MGEIHFDWGEPPVEEHLNRLYTRIANLEKIVKKLLYYWATKDILWTYKDEGERQRDMEELIKELDNSIKNEQRKTN